MLGEAPAQWARALAGGRPLVSGVLTPSPGGPALQGRRLYAFAGIGRPEKFFATLRDAGAELVECRAFADHHRFRRGEIEEILARAESQQAQAITTEKDQARLPADLAGRVEALPVRVAWRDPAAVDRLLGRLFDRL